MVRLSLIHSRRLLLLVSMCGVLLPGMAQVSSHDGRERYLFIWAGDQARTNPDFLAVVNFDERSSEYGKVITTVPLPGPRAAANEPHHVGLSLDGKVLACGGGADLLAVELDESWIFEHPRSTTWEGRPSWPLLAAGTGRVRAIPNKAETVLQLEEG